MELYLGESIAEINVNDDCVVISDEFLEFISINLRNFPIDMSSLKSINPCSDEIIPVDKVEQLYLLSIALKKLEIFDYEFKQMIDNLERITRTAMDSNCKIVSIGG